MSKCRHLATTDAEELRPGGDWTPVACFLCTWPCNNPHLAAAPAWIGRTIGGGYPVNPKTECLVCPAFEKQIEETKP